MTEALVGPAFVSTYTRSTEYILKEMNRKKEIDKKRERERERERDRE